MGRLDFDTEGLLLLTNDGELAHGLTHPSSQTPKVYQVKIEGLPKLEVLEALQTGVLLEDGPAQASEVFMVNPGQRVSKRNTWLQLTVTEGRNRLVRRMLEQVGHPVMRLRRVGFSSLTLTEALRPGQWRDLKADEVRKLKKYAQGAIEKRERALAAQQARDEEWGYEF